MLSPSQTAASVDTCMIALVPQSGQRHRRTNGLTASAQRQWLSGCFIVVLLFLTPLPHSWRPNRIVPAGEAFMSHSKKLVGWITKAVGPANGPSLSPQSGVY